MIDFVMVTKAMKDLTLTCIVKTNFPEVDVCLFDLFSCVDYGAEVIFDLQTLKICISKILSGRKR